MKTYTITKDELMLLRDLGEAAVTSHFLSDRPLIIKANKLIHSLLDQPEPPPIPKEKIDQMVNRFLCWELPADFAPDAGIHFKPINHPTSWPVGTNLFTADQAKAMLVHVAEPLLAQSRQKPDAWQIRYTDGDGKQLTSVYKVNVIDEYRAIFPEATSEPLYTHPALAQPEQKPFAFYLASAGTKYPPVFGNTPPDERASWVALYTHPAPAQPEQAACWCHKCNKHNTVNGLPFAMMRMIVCPQCGNKRCPKASDHQLDCTGSNEPGQSGSVYTTTAPAQPLTAQADWTDEQLQMLNFLYGAGEWDGLWFEEKHPTKKGAFWWRTDLRRLFTYPPAQPEQMPTGQQIDAMVDRFLGWGLPFDFNPDAGISFQPSPNINDWPIGTNLLTAQQAKDMFVYVTTGKAIPTNEIRPHRD